MSHCQTSRVALKPAICATSPLGSGEASRPDNTCAGRDNIIPSSPSRHGQSADDTRDANTDVRIVGNLRTTGEIL